MSSEISRRGIFYLDIIETNIILSFIQCIIATHIKNFNAAMIADK